MLLLYKLMHHAWHANSMAQRVHSQVGQLVSFFPHDMLSAFWHYKSQPMEKKLPVYFQSYFFMSYNLSIQRLQVWGLNI